MLFRSILFLLLLYIRPEIPNIVRTQGNLSIFDVPAAKEERKAARHAQAQKRQATQPQSPRPVLPPPPVRVPSKAWSPPEGMIFMDSKEFASADLSKIKGTGNSNAHGETADSGSDYGPGQGPNGVRLYRAEWYREPSDAELDPYLPGSGAPLGSWAEIACKTIDHYHVEDCQELGESPPGSGLARALRRASWQFLVRPPRKGGKVLVGEWVSIRFNFIKRPGDG